jgi:hypothetical protein
MVGCCETKFDTEESDERSPKLRREAGISIRDNAVRQTKDGVAVLDEQLGPVFGGCCGVTWDEVHCFCGLFRYREEGIESIR